MRVSRIDAVTSVPAIQTRPSSSKVTGSARARSASRAARDRPAVLAGLDLRAAGAQAVGDSLDPVALLDAKLGGSAHDALAARMRGEQRHERQLVDESRNLGRADLDGTELRVLDLDV